MWIYWTYSFVCYWFLLLLYWCIDLFSYTAASVFLINLLTYLLTYCANVASWPVSGSDLFQHGWTCVHFPVSRYRRPPNDVRHTVIRYNHDGYCFINNPYFSVDQARSYAGHGEQLPPNSCLAPKLWPCIHVTGAWASCHVTSRSLSFPTAIVFFCETH